MDHTLGVKLKRDKKELVLSKAKNCLLTILFMVKYVSNYKGFFLTKENGV